MCLRAMLHLLIVGARLGDQIKPGLGKTGVMGLLGMMRLLAGSASLQMRVNQLELGVQLGLELRQCAVDMGLLLIELLLVGLLCHGSLRLSLDCLRFRVRLRRRWRIRSWPVCGSFASGSLKKRLAFLWPRTFVNSHAVLYSSVGPTRFVMPLAIISFWTLPSAISCANCCALPPVPSPTFTVMSSRVFQFRGSTGTHELRSRTVCFSCPCERMVWCSSENISRTPSAKSRAISLTRICEASNTL